MWSVKEFLKVRSVIDVLCKIFLLKGLVYEGKETIVALYPIHSRIKRLQEFYNSVQHLGEVIALQEFR